MDGFEATAHRPVGRIHGFQLSPFRPAPWREPEQSCAEGMNDYISKPVDFQQLAEVTSGAPDLTSPVKVRSNPRKRRREPGMAMCECCSGSWETASLPGTKGFLEIRR